MSRFHRPSPRITSGEFQSFEFGVLPPWPVQWLDLDQLAARPRRRFEVALKQGLHEVIKERYPEYVNDDSGKPKEFFVAFYNMPEVSRIRDMKMPSIGTLGAINGTVTRTTDVRPELMYGRFICKECGANVGPIEQQFKYTEPTVCSNEGCQNRSKWTLNVRESKFVDWQRVRVQENADEIPAGSMPRSVDVILRNSACDKAKPGDKCTFVGTLVVVPDVGQLYKQGSVQTAMSRPPRGVAGRGSGEGVTGLKALGAKDLTYRTAFLAHTVKRANNSVINSSEEETAEAEAAVGLSDDQKQSYDELAESGKVYAEIVRSMGPTIHGLTDVKKGVALMLMGGVHKRTPEGIKLRGDINVCIVGDPSTAKSQVSDAAIAGDSISGEHSTMVDPSLPPHLDPQRSHSTHTPPITTIIISDTAIGSCIECHPRRCSSTCTSSSPAACTLQARRPRRQVSPPPS